MPTLIEHLRSLNRKERFILLREALGDHTFRLDRAFREKLGGTLRVSIPEDAFVAMDYHLDWLQMALYLTATPTPPSLIPKDALRGDFNKNQMDTDLLVAFEDGGTAHVVLLEAKMETGWSNEQLRKKAERLREIFGDEPQGPAVPHFVLASPEESGQIETAKWPPWMKPGDKPLWMRLPRPADLRKVTRCDDSRPNADGDFLRIDPV